jgi:hypothetical protein
VAGGGAPSSCEIGASQRGSEPWNTEAEGSTPWKAVTRQTVKTRQITT